MLRRPRALEERLRSRIPEQPEAVSQPRVKPQVQAPIPKTAVVPASSLPSSAHIVCAMVEARRVVSDPLESQVSSLLLSQAMETEPTWYQTKLASKVASDLQQSSALNMIFQSVEIADPHRDDKNREWEKSVSDVLTQGKSLVNRLQRYEADFWNPDLRDLAGRILRIIHPDGRDPRLVARFNVDNLREMYQRALPARSGHRSASTGLFVKDAERVLNWQVRTLLAQGHSLDEISNREPKIGEDLQFIRWLRFVKARQAEIAEQLVSGRKRHEDHSAGHVEAFGVIVGAIDSISTYSGLSEYPCRTGLLTLQNRLHEVEKLAEDIENIDQFPMAKYKAEALQTTIEELVRPVIHIASIAMPAGSGRESPMMASAVNSLGTTLEYADSAARSYLEWLREREASKKPFNRQTRPAAW